jgi:sugar/nucleoside kinase (ribokinase family)
MTKIDYLLIGHCTADLVGDGRVLGGTVSYAALIAQRFGQRVGIFTSAAADEPLLKKLLPAAELSIRLAENTTTFSNIYGDKGRIQYVHALAAPLIYEMLPVGWIDAPLVHLAPLVNEVDFSFAKHFPNSTVLLTPQGYMREWGIDGKVAFKAFLDTDVLAAVDMLVLSKQDIAEAPELEYEFSKYTKHVIVTNGDSGGTYYYEGEAIPYSAYPGVEIDPTGAGDVFAASLLSSLPLLNYDMNAAIRVAARLAALAVTIKGAEPAFTSDDVRQIIQEAKIGQ